MTDTDEGRTSVAAALRALELHEWVDRSGSMLLANKAIAETIRTLARQLAEARDHAARLDHDLDVVMSERGAAQDALQETHIALGGEADGLNLYPRADE